MTLNRYYKNISHDKSNNIYFIPWVYVFVGDSPEGLKKPGESCLKPEKNKTKHTTNLSTHAQHGPHSGGPRSSPE
jgi:hypothetical protein